MKHNMWSLIGLLCCTFFVTACSQDVNLVWPACASGEAVIVIQGTFNPSGEELLELKPIQRHAWRSKPTPCQPEGHFSIEVVFATGKVILVPFDALIADDADPGGMKHGFFEVVVPVNSEISLVRIVGSSDGTTFATIEGSHIIP